MKTFGLLVLSLSASITALNAQTITTVAGSTCGYSGNGFPATAAQMNGVVNIGKDAAGNLYMAEQISHVIRKVNSAGVISTYAGTGIAGFSGDGGPATLAQLDNPVALAVTKDGTVYVSGAGSRVRKIDPSGTITTFAGNGTTSFSGDGGAATAAGMGSGIKSIAIDTGGNILLGGANRIRKVDQSGIITTIAGTGVNGFSGDGGPAISAKVSVIAQIAVDRNNNIFFADNANYRIRRIDAVSEVIGTVAGSGLTGATAEGVMATDTRLNSTHGIIVDSCGNMYLSTSDHLVRIVNTEGRIFTLAGSWMNGLGGDGGPATVAKLNKPEGLLLDLNNDLYIADFNNCRVRMISLPRCDSMVWPTSVGGFVMEQPGLHVFPNPTEGNFSLRINTGNNTPVQVSIVNMVGAVVQQLTLQPGKDMPVNVNLPMGLYMVVAEAEKGKLVEKLKVKN